MKTNCFSEMFRMASGKDNFLGVANGSGDKELVDYINSILDNLGVILYSREEEESTSSPIHMAAQ
ncbi:MAG: hypothetical protein RSF86_14920 [Angelakisella sp.]